MSIISSQKQEIAHKIIHEHKKLLREAKAFDLFNFMSKEKFPGDPSKNIHIPYITKPLFKNEKRFVELLQKILFTFNDNNYVQMTYDFFTHQSNLKHFKYFAQCCFPSMFNYFSSLEYSTSAYHFIIMFFGIEKISNDQPQDIYALTDSLIISFILHNFQFRQTYLEEFYEMMIVNSNVSAIDAFYFLIKSFQNSISYLNKNQLSILSERLNVDNQERELQLKIPLFKNIFIELIKIWQYTPQFCTNELFEENYKSFFPDNPSQIESTKYCLIDYILNYTYNSNDAKINDALKSLFDAISKPKCYLEQKEIGKSLDKKKDFLIFSDYDVILINWIIMQGSDEIPFDGTNMIRSYQRQQDFCSEENALKLFYLMFNVQNLPSSQRKIRQNLFSPIHYIKKEIESLKQIKTSVILKYSNNNFLSDEAYDELMRNWSEIEKPKDFFVKTVSDESNESNESNSFWESNLKLYLFGQLIIHMNRTQMEIPRVDDFSNIPKFSNNVKFALNRSISFKNSTKEKKTLNIYYKGFRFLFLIELMNSKYSEIDIKIGDYNILNPPKGLFFFDQVKEELTSDKIPELLREEFKSKLDQISKELHPKSK